MMGKVIDKMMEENDKASIEEMLPALTIKVSTDGTATVTKDKDEDEDEDKDLVEEKE